MQIQFEPISILSKQMCLESGQNENEWYPWGLQISLHIPSPGFSEMGGGAGRVYFGVNFGHLKYEVFRKGGRGLSGLKFQKGAFWKIWTKIYCLRNVYRNVVCITDSLSHVETNDCDKSA